MLSAIITGNAQEYRPVTLDGYMGLGLSNTGGYYSKADSKVSFLGGVSANFNINYSWYIQTRLEYVNKGSEYDKKKSASDGSKEREKLDSKSNYIQLPVQVGSKMYIDDNLWVFMQIGPYIGYGISGKSKRIASSIDANGDETILSQEKINTFDKEAGLKRFDFGAGFALGTEYNKTIVRIGCDFGLISINKGNNKYKNRHIYASLGYRF